MSDLTPSDEVSRQHELTHMIDTMRTGQLEVVKDGKNIEIKRQLGTGGSKAVYDATLDNESFALALPNTIDGVGKMQSKWQTVLREPENTTRIRELGLYTNPQCEILPLTINGVDFSGLRMWSYEDLPFPIMDRKNRQSSTVTTSTLPSDLSSTSFQSMFGGALKDLSVLIKNGVQLGSDSFNIAIIDGKPRVYLNDLGIAQFTPFVADEINEVSGEYVRNTLSAFINGLSEEEYTGHKNFFNGESFRFDNPDRISNLLAKSLSQSITDKDSND